MKRQLGASGDFAWAYVIAHEMGHHVQQLARHRARGRAGCAGRTPATPTRSRSASSCRPTATPASGRSTVYKEGDLEHGDLDEAFGAAAAVGDDRLQRQATGSVDPDTFTHGTSEQRRPGSDRGYDSGDPGDCDTFSAEI